MTSYNTLTGPLLNMITTKVLHFYNWSWNTVLGLDQKYNLNSEIHTVICMLRLENMETVENSVF
jgi:hypothetical protein